MVANLPDVTRCWRKPVTEAAVRAAVERFGARLRAVVLTGSLARDEATFIRDGGRWKTLGDADFFLVFHRQGTLPSEAEIRCLSENVECALSERQLAVPIGLAAVDAAFLRKLPPHIATYELRECGRVVWGDPDALALVPRFAAAEISREDAWRMLGNRMLEILEVLASAAAPEEQSYRNMKLWLDMATSYLVFAGRYRPTYREREAALRAAAGDEAARREAPFPLGEFARHVSACTRWKLAPEAGGPETAEAREFMRPLWRWELARLGGGDAASPEGELMRRWMSCQPLREKLHGWASVMRRCGWQRNWREWPRWIRLARQASPRYWVYAAAAELFFARGESAAEAIGGKLPLLRREGSPEEGWRTLAGEAAWNYRRFLETTRA